MANSLKQTRRGGKGREIKGGTSDQERWFRSRDQEIGIVKWLSYIGVRLGEGK